jgi:uncharacterized RDD family membrane protein YckC
MNVPNQPKDQAPAPPVEAVLPTTGWGALMSGFAIIPLVLFLAFHFGAGYLSYQKYGSFGWAFLDFIFAYFYYPYYAFFLAKDPGPSMGMIGGRKSLAKALLGKLFK